MLLITLTHVGNIHFCINNDVFPCLLWDFFIQVHSGMICVGRCIGLNVGSCVAFFVVMGDLGPAIISRMFGWEVGFKFPT